MSNNQQQQSKTITDIVRPEINNLAAILSLNSDKDASAMQVLALQELNYLEQHTALKPAILQCEPNSIILAVKNVMRKNLSLDPSAGLVYVKSRNVNIGTYEKPNWKTVLEVQETANGLLSYNRQLGRIMDYTNPKIKEDDNGKTIGVSMQILKPSYPQPRWEEYSFNEGDFMRWRKASHKENKKGYKQGSNKPVPDDDTLNYANPNYTNWKNGLDPEFARAKCIRHSLKKLGSNPNENMQVIINGPKFKPVIDINVAESEADDDNQGYVQHEEVHSAINENQNQQTDSFNSNDL